MYCIFYGFSLDEWLLLCQRAVRQLWHKMAAKTLYDLQLVPNEEHFSHLLLVLYFILCLYCMISTLFCSPPKICKTDIIFILWINVLGSICTLTVDSLIKQQCFWFLCVSIVIYRLNNVLLKWSWNFPDKKSKINLFCLLQQWDIWLLLIACAVSLKLMQETGDLTFDLHIHGEMWICNCRIKHFHLISTNTDIKKITTKCL